MTSPVVLIGNLGPTEIILILLVIVLLFGAKKLPELARGSGRALRIFKAETKGLVDDNDNVAEKAEPPYSRQPLHPTEIHQPGQPGYQAPPAGYQQPGYQQPNGQQFQQPQQPPAQPYVDPVQRTNDR